MLQNHLDHGIVTFVDFRLLLTQKKHEVNEMTKHLHVDRAFLRRKLRDEEGDDVRVFQNDPHGVLAPRLEYIVDGIENRELGVEVRIGEIVESEQIMEQSPLEDEGIELRKSVVEIQAEGGYYSSSLLVLQSSLFLQVLYPLLGQ